MTAQSLNLTPQEIFQSLFDWLWSLTAHSLNPDASRNISFSISLAVVADCAESQSWQLKKKSNLCLTSCGRWLRRVSILTPQEIFQSLFDWLWSLTAHSLNPDNSRNISIPLFDWLWSLTVGSLNPDALRNISRSLFDWLGSLRGLLTEFPCQFFGYRVCDMSKISVWLAVIADCAESQSWSLKKSIQYLYLTDWACWLRRFWISRQFSSYRVCPQFLFDWLVSLTAQSLNPNANLPVIVFIHGGAFIFGSSNDAGPEYLLEGGFYL